MGKIKIENFRNFINLFLIAIIIGLSIIIFKNNNNTKIKENNNEPVIRIGAGDDISGIVLDYMQLETNKFKLEPYFIKDC